ncbi:hypothetical protein SVA_1061 [Sulfurifustis variabilis]|uniref:DUF72 domain-containing protein n=1 Tax=Sulfurifustis variabilis TaxID=1675686 RepID=A0A1B4V295_9GAMM|nr:DUF72 domain-containing protein [Sulfurifustis variabilis]BAU47640.1 hypothetical protein SVA_1061 [Sulfurifustis variabilis]
MSEIRVGATSWAEKTLIESGRFYPPGVDTAEDRLRYYASRFAMVEVDSTYYGLPSEHNALLWASRTPPGFVFHVKAFRLFTQHQTPPEALPRDVRQRVGVPPKKNVYYDDLPDDARDDLWRRFRLALEPLRASGKLGAVLFQFPPWFVHRRDSLAHIEGCVRRMNGDLLAVEFRNRSWFDERHRDATLEFERRLRLVHVVTDAPQGFPSSTPPVWEVTNPALAIVRLHGRNAATWQQATRTAAERFDYLYSDEELESFVGPVRAMASQARAVHVLFNNCRDDKAQRNAALLQSKIRG